MSTQQKNINKQRIVKNTLILYVRMIFVMITGFYTLRLLLTSLGIEDYGLYNVIFGLVTAFSFFSGAMQSTVQRFLCYEMGEGSIDNVKKVFGVSVFLFLLVALAVFILAETAGLWFVDHRMSIAPDKMDTARTIYHISIFMVIFKLLQIPYVSAVTSHENMGVYSWFCIGDSFLHLVSVLGLKFVMADKLICFVAFYTISNLLILILYVLYCCKKYEECRVFRKFDRQYLKDMGSFFSWSLLGATANVLKQHGLNLLLNLFYGVVLNATWGIATQVGNAANQLVASFQQAFNPQILKSYTTSDKKAYFELLQSCSKYSFMLVWLIALPVLLQTEFLLKLWLGAELPTDVVIFTRLMIVYMLFEALSCPLWVAVQAVGDINRYQIEISCISGSSFIFSLIALEFGAAAVSVAVISAAVNMLALIYRIFYLQKKIRFSVSGYWLKALLPVMVVTLGSGICGVVINRFSGESWLNVILCLILSSVVNVVIMLLFALSGQERKYLRNYFYQKIFSGSGS